MINILFVDDEANVLDGLRRMLRPMRREWEMDFTVSGVDALSALAEKAYDVIVSDMRMPGMDGIELLTEVMHSYPRTIRLALSGHAEVEKILEAARVAHQYLAKPCESETLIDTVNKACGLRELFDSPELKSALGGIDSLPSLPKFYSDLMDEIADPNSDIMRVGAIISKDVAMASKVMQLVNSSFFGIKQHISSPAQAASMLGLNTIKGLAITTQAFSVLDASETGFDMEKLWRHSSVVAVIAERISTLESDDKKLIGNTFIAGLLHDIGKLVMAIKLPDHYQKFCSLRSDNQTGTLDAEQAVFGCSHAEVGAYLANLWGFPNPIVEAIAFHHAPQRSVGNSFMPLTAVYVAEALVSYFENDASGDDDEIPLDKIFLQRIGKENQASAWLEICREYLQEVDENE